MSLMPGTLPHSAARRFCSLDEVQRLIEKPAGQIARRASPVTTGLPAGARGHPNQVLVSPSSRPGQPGELVLGQVRQSAAHGEGLPHPLSTTELHQAPQAPGQRSIGTEAFAEPQAYRQVDDVDASNGFCGADAR